MGGALAAAQLETCMALSVTQLLLLHFPECPEIMRCILYFLESFCKHQQA